MRGRVVCAPPLRGRAEAFDTRETVEDLHLVDVQTVVEGLREIRDSVRIEAVTRPPADVVTVERGTQAVEARLVHGAGRVVPEAESDVPETPEAVDPAVEDVTRRTAVDLLEHRAVRSERDKIRAVRREERLDGGHSDVGMALPGAGEIGSNEDRRNLRLRHRGIDRRLEVVLADADRIRPPQLPLTPLGGGFQERTRG